MGKSSKKNSEKKQDLSSESESENTEEVIKKEKQKIEKAEERWRPKQLFVSGIPYTATQDSLKEFFTEFQGSIG